MRTIAITFAVAFVLGGSRDQTYAQSIKNGALSGTIVSASSVVPPGGRTDLDLLTSVTAKDRAKNKFLVVTQICVLAQSTTGFTRVSGDGWNVPFVGTGQLTCERFEPGLPVFPPGRGTVACLSVGAGGAECTIVGVLSSK
jgi:hypothetical protein